MWTFVDIHSPLENGNQWNARMTNWKYPDGFTTTLITISIRDVYNMENQFKPIQQMIAKGGIEEPAEE